MSEPVPQLKMIIGDLQEWSPPPVPALPEPFFTRTSQPGDNKAWCTIISEAFGQDFGEAEWQREIISREGYQPDRVFFVVHRKSDEPVATASAMRIGGEPHGYLRRP